MSPSRPPPSAPAGPPPIAVRGLTRNFGPVRALKGVDLELLPGEVLSVIGENGAGKSTLMRILAGVDHPSAGDVMVDGLAVRFRTVRDAQSAGVSFIHQELNLAPHLDVASNLFLGRELRRVGFIRTGDQHRAAREVLDSLGLSIDVGALVQNLSPGHRQLVEIAKALTHSARVLILDEPTSSLSPRESEALFAVLARLRQSGVSILYVSHRLSEVAAISDRVVALRDGALAGTLTGDRIRREEMVKLMVGRDLVLPTPATHTERPVAFEWEGLRTDEYPQHALSLKLGEGEVVGLAGLVGSGRTAALETAFGARRRVGGTVRLRGTSLQPGGPADSLRVGLALVPEDRKHHGLILDWSILWNLSLPIVSRDARYGWVDRDAEAHGAQEAVRRLSIKARNPLALAASISGGNQQKVVFGKGLAVVPKVLLLDEPTRGVDVGARNEIHRLIRDLAAAGLPVLFASSEMEEVLQLADRVVVFHEGRIAGTLSRQEATEESVMSLATGGVENL